VNKIAIKFVLVIALLGVSLGSNCISKQVYAQYYSQEEGNPRIIIDKQIRPITDDKFYDNLTTDQKLFIEGDTLEFKIRIENSGNQTLNNVKLTDNLPKYLSLMFYPGVFDKTSNSIEADIGTLNAGQFKEYIIRAKVVDLPVANIACENQQINKAKVVSDTASDSDEAKYMTACKVVPTTGPNDMAVKTLIIVVMTMIGVCFRKYSRGF
jgi:uncharacterized repeat protein (TIGR01451 family)